MRDTLLIVPIVTAATWLGAGVTVGFLTPRLRRVDVSLILLAIIVMVLKLGA